jgi:hypothetical protein
MTTKIKTPKKKHPTQGDCLRRFDDNSSSYGVGESAQQPGQVQIVQYSMRLVGPISPARARMLAAQLIAAAEAIEARYAIIEFRSGSYLGDLAADRGVSRDLAQHFPSREAAEALMAQHEWIVFNGGMVVEVEATS